MRFLLAGYDPPTGFGDVPAHKQNIPRIGYATMTDQPQGNRHRFGFGLFAALHVICCGVPLLILSGVSLSTLWERGPTLAVVLAVSVWSGSSGT
jgi:hypothetical protein